MAVVLSKYDAETLTFPKLTPVGDKTVLLVIAKILDCDAGIVNLVADFVVISYVVLSVSTIVNERVAIW